MLVGMAASTYLPHHMGFPLRCFRAPHPILFQWCEALVQLKLFDAVQVHETHIYI